MRLPVRLAYDLAEGSLRRRGRPVSLPPSYHLITGLYHLKTFLRFGKHFRETASFQQKKPPLAEWPSIIVELRGFEPLTLSMPWRCATSCAIAPKSALQTSYKIHHRHEPCNFRRVARFRKASYAICNTQSHYAGDMECATPVMLVAACVSCRTGSTVGGSRCASTCRSVSATTSSSR